MEGLRARGVLGAYAVAPSAPRRTLGSGARGLLPVLGWLSGCGGCPEGCCHRRMIGAVRCLVDGGIKWWAVPAGFPLWPRVCVFFARWRDTGLVTELYGRLGEAVRAAVKVVAPGCARGVVVLQSVKVRVTVALGSRGFGAGKRVNGRKRHLLTETLGFLLAVLVIAASVAGRGGASDPSSPGCAGHRCVCGRPGWCLGPVLHAWGLWRVRVSGRPFLSLVCPGVRPGSAF
ncbi:transposase [Streptomyces sp. RM1]